MQETFAEVAKVVLIPISQIEPDPNQPREYFDQEELEVFAANLAKHGQRQPIKVRMIPNKPGFYMIVYGERRWRSLRIAGLDTVKAIIAEFESNDEAFEDSFLENVDRVDMTPLEVARGMQRLIKDRGYTPRDLEVLLSKSDSYVAMHLALFELDPQVLMYLDPARPEKERLPLSTAFRLRLVPKNLQFVTATEIVDRGMRAGAAHKLIEGMVQATAPLTRRAPRHYRVMLDTALTKCMETLVLYFIDDAAVDRAFSTGSSEEVDGVLGVLTTLIDSLMTLKQRILAVRSRRFVTTQTTQTT